MKVKITGCLDPLTPNMWYSKRIGEVFEVGIDPQFDNYYKTVKPVHKEQLGHIKKIDCIEVLDVLPKAIESNE